jgi:hypothetical protein
MGIGRGALLFQKYGLAAKDASGNALSGMEVMGNVAEKMSKLGTNERVAMAGRLGIDPLLAKQMAEMGRAKFMNEIAEAEKGGILSENDYKVADATSIAFAQLHGTVKKFVALIAIQLGPTIQQVTKAFQGWVKENRELIVQKTREVFEKVRAVASMLIGVIVELVKHGTALKIVLGLLIALKMGEKFGTWVRPLMDVVASLTKGAGAAEGMKAGLAGLKSIATGGLIAAIALLVEDLWAFSNGGDSVTGWLLERFPYAVEVAKGAIALLSGALVAMVSGSGPLGLLVAGIGGFVIAAQNLKDSWNPVMQWFGERWDRIADKVRTFAKVVAWPAWLVAKVTGHVNDVFGKDKGQNIRKSPEEYQKEAEEQEANAYRKSRHGIGVMAEEPGNMLTWGRGPLMASAAAAGGATVVNNQNVGPTTINVSGAGDPKKVAAEVMREQERRAQSARSRTRDAQPAHR